MASPTAPAAAPAPFTVVPVVHAKGGRVVERVDVASVARSLGEIYLADLAGSHPDVELLARVSRGIAVWADAAPRSPDDAMDVLLAGAARVTVRPSALRRGDLRELADMSDAGSVYLAIEPGAAPDEVSRDARDLGFGLVVAAARFDPALARAAAMDVERWWLGPVSEAEARELAALGYAGVVVPVADAPALRAALAPAPEGAA